MRRLRLLMMLLSFLLLCGCAEEKKQLVSLEEYSEESLVESTDESVIYVHVCGAVCNEGVYRLPYGSRVYEAIAIAGGLTEDAARDAINQAELLEDGMKLYIPTKKEVEESLVTGNGKVNINKASKEQLMTLPGVGESRAETILQYRDDKGPFRKIEDIMNVTGIKEGLFTKIKDLITI